MISNRLRLHTLGLSSNRLVNMYINVCYYSLNLFQVLELVNEKDFLLVISWHDFVLNYFYPYFPMFPLIYKLLKLNLRKVLLL